VVAGVAEHREDAMANGGAGGTRDEVAIRRRYRLAEHDVEPDDRAHRGASLPGITIVTCEPGNHGRVSIRGSSSSHAGTMATRAVPLRTEIFPSHRAR